MSRDDKVILTEQIIRDNVTMADWVQYRAIQELGVYNMLDPNARKLSDMSKGKWLFIIKHYSKISEVYNG